MDEMVLSTQKWLNETYNGRTGWVSVEENGRTGWDTIDGLIRAFQIECGSTTPNGALGPWTLTQLQELGSIGRDDNAQPNNIIRILQGAMWCKGYWSAALTGVFDETTENGIKNLQEDIGITQTGRVGFYMWKSLLSMDQFVMLSGGEAGIRSFQQYFNSNYANYFEKYVSCDGLAGRDLYTCFIYMLQKDEGFDAANAFGTFGNTTYELCPNITSLNANKYADTIRCLKIAIHLEGFTTIPYTLDTSAELTQRLINEVNNFNEFMMQSEYSTSSGIMKQSIKQLFTSNGYVGRYARACDTATPINTNERAAVLKNNNIDTVGRYLTYGIINGENKQLTKNELNILRTNGLNVIPIYQSSADTLAYFNYEQGVEDAKNAYNLAQGLSLPANTEIYFAVDYDVLEGNIPYYIIPYFEGINSVFLSKSTYKVGIYGTRNVCTHVLKEKLASRTYVSNMSTGYSGNMGFAMPKNWSFNQFNETSISYGGVTLNIDKVDMNETDMGVSSYNDEEAAVRRYTEELLGCVGFRGLLTNVELPLSKEITLATTPIIVTVKADATYEPPVGNGVITVTKNPNGTLEASLNSKIAEISTSFNFDQETSSQVTTTLTTVFNGLPNGTALKVGLSIEGGYLVYKFISSTKDFEFEDGSFSVSCTLTLKIPPTINPKYRAQFEQIASYTVEQNWATFCATVENFTVTLENSIDSKLIVTTVSVVIAGGMLYAIYVLLGLLIAI